jgi:membrane associated rhomboid family serine protease
MDVCYRHPGRETGVRCSNCDRPICPDCMTTTSVGMRCPECARQRTKVRGMPSVGGDPVVTYALIAINVVVALGAFLGGASATSGGIGSSRLLIDGSVYRAAIADGEYWRLLTSGFLHVGFFHLATNMFSLYILGQLLEPVAGHVRFAIIYFVSLLTGSFGALVVTAGPTVGASGAIFGLMAAAALVLRSRGIGIMESGLGIWIGLNLLITFAVPGISVGGHIGGLVGGAIAAFVLFDLRQRLRVPDALPAVVCGLVAALAVVGSIVVSSGP